jgi:hypothetical protein
MTQIRKVSKTVVFEIPQEEIDQWVKVWTG